MSTPSERVGEVMEGVRSAMVVIMVRCSKDLFCVVGRSWECVVPDVLESQGVLCLLCEKDLRVKVRWVAKRFACEQR